MGKLIHRYLAGFATAFVLAMIFSQRAAYATLTREISIKAGFALQRFKKEISGGNRFFSSAIGALVFPDAVKAGFGTGREYGEGEPRAGRKTV